MRYSRRNPQRLGTSYLLVLRSCGSYEFIGLSTLMIRIPMNSSKNIQLYRAFDRDAQTPYEIKWLLRIMIDSLMLFYVFFFIGTRDILCVVSLVPMI